jgi:stage V sporulation protein G
VEISEVRIKLMDDPHDRLQAFCSITLDSCFVIRDLKIIQGAKGSFVAMPSRKLMDRCPRCHCKNHLRALYCNHCGAKLDEERALRDVDGRAKLYADIAHPINSDCRERIQAEVLEAFEEELVRSKQPGYICMYDDYGEDSYAMLSESDDELALPRAVALSEDGRSHRFEQPAASANSPHHQTAPIREPAHAMADGDGRAQADGRCDEDDFGAGLL